MLLCLSFLFHELLRIDYSVSLYEYDLAAALSAFSTIYTTLSENLHLHLASASASASESSSASAAAAWVVFLPFHPEEKRRSLLRLNQSILLE